MTANRRIVLNILATYGRSLFSFACGLFSARWVLMSLGQEDYGLYGVVGGMVLFVGMVNNLLSIAIGRFYAVSVGSAAVAEDKLGAVIECRRWFSTAVMIHTVIPILLMIVGYPLGEYAIRMGWVVVPSEKLSACLWVFRFSCCSCLVGMMTVPFNAMYSAKQYIAELTIYSFVTTSLNMAVFYYMVTHPSAWLKAYSAWMALVSVVPNLIIALRARFLFPECHLIASEFWSFSRFSKLVKFAGWQAFGGLGNVCRSQGIAILLNRHVEFGPTRNSSMSVANQIAGQTDMLSSAMLGAFQPAIANAYGAADPERMRMLSFCTCKVGTFLSLLFAVPLALELPEILSVWLKDPPDYAVGLCLSILVAHVVDRTSSGHMLAVTAAGRIAAYQAFLGTALLLALPLSYVFLRFEFGIYSVGWAIAMTAALCAWGRIWFAYKLVGMSAVFWLRRIFAPIFLLALVSVLVGYLPHFAMNQSLIRLGVTTVVSESVLLTFAWCVLFGEKEREYLRIKVGMIINRVKFHD